MFMDFQIADMDILLILNSRLNILNIVFMVPTVQLVTQVHEPFFLVYSERVVSGKPYLV